MSWVSENKFLAGFGAVMIVGVGALGYLTWSAMGKYDDATGAFDSAAAVLKKLQETKPSLTDKHLKELLAQKQALTDKIADFQKELKSRVLPVEPIKKEAFQDKLKETVAQITTKAAEAKVERPKDFYMGFAEYQSKPPDEKAAPALARQLRAIELALGVLIKTGNLELDELHRDPLPEEGRVKADDAHSGSGRRKTTGGGSGGVVERNGIRLKITSTDDALRKILTEFANHKEQLFVIRNVSVQNKQTESPQRLAAAPLPPASPVPTPGVPATPEQPAPGPGTPPPPPPPVPESTPPPQAQGGSLAYVFGTEKIVSTIELEVLNIEEPKARSEKTDKSGKKKEK